MLLLKSVLITLTERRRHKGENLQSLHLFRELKKPESSLDVHFAVFIERHEKVDRGSIVENDVDFVDQIIAIAQRKTETFMNHVTADEFNLSQHFRLSCSQLVKRLLSGKINDFLRLFTLLYSSSTHCMIDDLLESLFRIFCFEFVT